MNLRYGTTILLLITLLKMQLNAQIASNDPLDFFRIPEELIFTEKDPNWPDCYTIQNLTIHHTSNQTHITWDNDQLDEVEFQLEILSTDESKSLGVFLTDKSNFILDQALNSDGKVRIRSICHDLDNELVYVGEWVYLNYSKNDLPPCPDMEAQIIGVDSSGFQVAYDFDFEIEGLVAYCGLEGVGGYVSDPDATQQGILDLPCCTTDDHWTISTTWWYGPNATLTCEVELDDPCPDPDPDPDPDPEPTCNNINVEIIPAGVGQFQDRCVLIWTIDADPRYVGTEILINEIDINGNYTSFNTEELRGINHVRHGSRINFSTVFNYTDSNGDEVTITCDTSLIVNCIDPNPDPDPVNPDSIIDCSLVNFELSSLTGECRLDWSTDPSAIGDFTIVDQQTGFSFHSGSQEGNFNFGIGQSIMVSYTLLINDPIHGWLSKTCTETFSCIPNDSDSTGVNLCSLLNIDLISTNESCVLDWNINNVEDFGIQFTEPFQYSSSSYSGSYTAANGGPIIYEYIAQSTVNGLIQTAVCVDTAFCSIDTTQSDSLLCDWVTFDLTENEEGDCILEWSSSELDDLQLEVYSNGVPIIYSGLSGSESINSNSIFINYELLYIENGDSIFVSCNTTLECRTFTSPEDPRCENIQFDLLNNIDGNCTLNWTSNASVSSLELLVSNGGFTFYSTELNDQIQILDPSEVDIVYTMEVIEGDSIISISCEELLHCESNDIITCDDINFILTNLNSETCRLDWNVNHVDFVQFDIYDDSGQLLESNQSPQGYFDFSTGEDIVIQSTLKYLLEGESQVLMCTDTFSCKSPSIDPADLCEVFSNLTAEVLDSNNLILKLSESKRNAIDSIFYSLGIEKFDFEQYVSFLENLILSIDYTNDIFSNSTNITVNLLDYSSNIDFYNWTYILENINIAGLDADFQISYIDLDGQSHACEIEGLSIVNNLDVEDEEPEEDPNLPLLNCGEDPDTTIQSQVLFDGDIVGQVVFFKGFPILIDYANGNNPYTGTAIAAVPFGSKYVSVDFDGLLVNENNKVISGTVTVASSSPGDYPDFSMDAPPLEIGGEICIEPEFIDETGSNGDTNVFGLDEWGFNEDGIHEATQTKWDRNGFDQDGVHHNGSEYNEFGCNREGFTADGAACDPSGGTAVLDTFINENLDTILFESERSLKDLLADFQNQLNDSQCDSIRAVMDNLIQELGYNPTFIKGDNNEYFEAGLSSTFIAEPDIVVTNIQDRDPKTEDLEKSHVDLYHCDVEEENLQKKIDEIQDICNQSQPNELIDHILEEIRKWGSWEKELYLEDMDAFLGWLEKIVENYLEQSIQEEDYGTINEDEYIKLIPSVNSIFDFNQTDNYSYVSKNEIVYFESDVLERLDFEFGQGSKEINGIHRAFYLERLAELNTSLFGGTAELLPLKIEKSVASFIFKIYLDNMVISTDGASLDAYLIVEDTESDRKIVFEGHNISFGAGGVGEESLLSLATDIELRLNNAAKLILNGTPGTYVAWDCSGFKHMGIDASIEFCPNFITPLNPDLSPMPDTARYRLDVAVANMSSWLDFELQVNADPFSLSQASSIAWELNNMVIDMSSTSTPNINLPQGYDSPELVNGTLSNGWKGFYIENLAIHLPNKFSDSSQPVSITADDIIIDGTGVTGKASAEMPLLSIEEGDVGGWPMSVNRFGVEVIQNHLTGIEFGGELNVPIFKENMGYDAVIYPGDQYAFTISPFSNATMDMALATATLKDNCSITVSYVDGEFYTKAILNGTLRVNGNTSEGGDNNIKIPSVGFNNLALCNKAPYFDAGQWQLLDDIQSNFKGFPLTVNDLGMYSPEGEDEYAGIMLDISLGLNEESTDNFGISASGSFGILGRLDTLGGRQKWVFEKLDPKGFCLQGNNFPGVKEISGCIHWYDGDPIYGEGFRGAANVKFTSIDLNVAAVAQFGKAPEGYKYFFVDAMAETGVGIPCGPFSLSGFGGGLSNHMQSDFDPNNLNFNSITGSSIPPDIGASFSGKTYLPSSTTCLGFSGAATFTLANKEELFNGKVEIGFEFSCSGGVQAVKFTGLGQFMNPVNFNIQARGNVQSMSAALAGYVHLDFDLTEPSFHGFINAHLNSPVLRGVGTDGFMVGAEVHFDPNDWWIYIGRPEENQRCGIEMPLLGLDIKAYLDVGTNIPNMPAPPSAVSEIAGQLDRNETLRQSGAGFMFGAGINVDLEANAVIAKATLRAGCGFDVMIKKYEGFKCQETGSAIGLDGWYAMGQLWAYMQGKLEILGVNVLSVGLAAILQTRMPNPTVFQGALGVYIKVLFATVRKTIRFKFGEECTLTSEGDGDQFGIDIITDIQPLENTLDVPTDQYPNISFAFNPNKEISMPDLNGNEHTYKFLIPENGIKLISSNNGDLHFDIIEERGAPFIELSSRNLLPGNDTITIEVTVDIYKNGSLVGHQTKSSSFVTADEYDVIPEFNIASAYPMDGMFNFYKNESRREKGFINLHRGQPNLFYNIPDHLRPKVKFTDNAGNINYLEYEYLPLKRQISFDLSKVELSNETFYKIELIHEPIDVSSSDGNNAAGDENEANVFYTAHFRTSKYNKFNDKILAMGQNSIDSNKKFGLIKAIQDVEIFDKIELGLGDMSLVTFEVDLNNIWMRDLKRSHYMFDVFPHRVGLSELCDEYVGTDKQGKPIDANDFVNARSFGYDFELYTTSESLEQALSIAPTDNNKITFNLYNRVNASNEVAKVQAKSCRAEILDMHCQYEGAESFMTSTPNSNTGTQEEYIDECIEEYLPLKVQNYDKEIPELYPGTYYMNIEYRLPDGTLSSSTRLKFKK